MAYELDNEEENDKEQQQAAQTLGAESGVITGDQQKAASTQNGTGNYTNLQSYIEQNQPAKFGEQFAGRVGETVDSANKGQSAANEGFRQKADANSVQQNEQLVNEAVGTPTSFVKDQNKLSQFRQQQNAQYGGPKNLSDEEELYSKAYNPTNLAQSESKTARTASGQKALLGQYYGAPAGRYDYSGGQKNLDQILIGMDPNSRAQLEQQQGRAKQAGDNFGLLQGELNQYANKKETETDNARKGVQSALGRAVPAWQQAVTGRVNQQLQGRDAQAQRINSALSQRQGESLTDEDKALLGLDLNQPLYNIGKGGGFNWVNPNLDANLQTLATPEEYDTSRAYATLENQPDTFLTGRSGTGPLLSAWQGAGGQTLADLQRSKARGWQQVQERGGPDAGDEAFYDPYSANPWYAADGATMQAGGRDVKKAYNIFNDPDLPELQKSLISQGRQRQVDEMEERKRALIQKYGALDYALQNSSAQAQAAQRISNTRS